MKQNKERHALVAGGTTGMGYELAKLLARDGRCHRGFRRSSFQIYIRYKPDCFRVKIKFTSSSLYGLPSL
jgi:hypothetical protein